MITHHLQGPVGSMIIPTTRAEVMTVTGLHVQTICMVVSKCTRATLAVNERWRREDGCNLLSWAQAGAEPAIHGRSRDQRRDVKGEGERGGEGKKEGGCEEKGGEVITYGQGAVDVLKAEERRSPFLGRRPTRGKCWIQSFCHGQRREGLERVETGGRYLSKKWSILRRWSVAVTGVLGGGLAIRSRSRSEEPWMRARAQYDSRRRTESGSSRAEGESTGTLHRCSCRCSDGY